MLTIRPYRKEDAEACGQCLYEGFFTCPVDENDKVFLREYAQVLIEKCNFTYVAETEDHEVVGFVSGKYDKHFSKALADLYTTRKHYGVWCKMFFFFYCKQYHLSSAFQKQFDDFFKQLRERDAKTFGTCDLELVALASKKDYRKGLGTALVQQFLERAKKDGAKHVRLFTNSLAAWQFYEKRGFDKVGEKPFSDGLGNYSYVYAYDVNKYGTNHS